MSKPRSAARRLALQALYQWQVTDQELSVLIDQFLGDPENRGYEVEYFLDLVRGVVNQQGQLDEVQYGDRRILIEAAQYTYLAVVVDGIEPPGFRAEMRERIIDIEHAHERVLRDYEGDASPLIAIDETLGSLMQLTTPSA